jgi:hypothetical protein
MINLVKLKNNYAKSEKNNYLNDVEDEIPSLWKI